MACIASGGAGFVSKFDLLRPRAQRSARLTLFDVLGNLRRRARVARWRGALAPNSIPSRSRARARPGRPPRRRPRRSAPPTLTARSMRPRERTSFATSACDFGEDLGAQAAASVSGSPRGRSPAPMSACPRAPSRPLRPTVVGPQPRNALRARAAGLGGGQSAGAGRGEAPTPRRRVDQDRRRRGELGHAPQALLGLYSCLCACQATE